MPSNKRPRTLAEAYQAAYRLLAIQARTESGLREALLRRGYSPEHVAEVIAEMVRLGYIDDVAAASRWAEHAAGQRRYGVRGIAARLTGRGIDPLLAAEAAQEAYEAEEADEYQVACDLAAARISPGELSDDELRERALRRVARFLERRGFGSDTISRVVRDLTH
ncbi:MAG TPA: regulatory protein RecX [Bacillota bacterium]|nr:regulatory protein RecX [Bacillota bacterium]